MTLNMSSSDFDDSALQDLGVSMTWYDSTKVKHPVTGVESLSYASGISITAVFVKRNQRYVQDVEGIVDLGDAAIYCSTSESVEKDDKILYNGETFIVIDKVKRIISGIHLFDACNLAKISGS